MNKAISQQTRIQHLYLRAGFGLKPPRLEEERKKSIRAVVKKLFKDSADFQPIQAVEESLASTKGLKGLDRQAFKEVMKESREGIKDLNVLWLDRMAHGPDALRQKMTLFWHGHFACKSRNAYFTQHYLNTLQQHALGKFGDLLVGIAKCPAMLQFLNNQQNRKSSPNENFAREVMELFTLGRGNYSEDDVKNAARAFTGWGFNPEGEFTFRENQHDEGPETIFGKTSQFTGEEVLRLILDKRETSFFICRKIYRYFVNEQVEPRRIQAMADRFYQSGYDIRDLMEYLFTSDWFYDSQHLGARIKSPLELLAGLTSTFGIRFEEKHAPLFLQKVLGQVALHPPGVAGWAEGRNWIDSSSLIFRMKLPEVIFKDSDVTTEAKDEGDVDTEHLARRNGRNIRTTIDWNNYLKAFAGVPDRELLGRLALYLLQTPVSATHQALIVKRADPSANREERIKNLTLHLLTLPEYQLC